MTRLTSADLEEARSRTVPDVIAPGLHVLLCGINPGLYSAATGYHFARPGNRFWPALYASGFTRTLLLPAQQGRLLELGLGITNLVARATASARELAAHELVAGGREVRAKVERYDPGVVAFLGVGAYRTAFESHRAAVGPQELVLGRAAVWLLPNPSGLNAHWRPDDLARAFAEVRTAAGL